MHLTSPTTVWFASCCCTSTSGGTAAHKSLSRSLGWLLIYLTDPRAIIYTSSNISWGELTDPNLQLVLRYLYEQRYHAHDGRDFCLGRSFVKSPKPAHFSWLLMPKLQLYLQTCAVFNPYSCFLPKIRPRLMAMAAAAPVLGKKPLLLTSRFCPFGCMHISELHEKMSPRFG